MRDRSRRLTSRYWITSKRYFGFIVLLLAVVIPAWSPAKAAESGDTKSAGGLTVYLGVVPAEITKNPPPHLAERPMHGGAPKGQHERHVVVAVYDSAGNTRIADATVTARVSGLLDPQKILEPMTIANTVTYGAYYNMPADLYTISVTIRRADSQAVVLDFKYDHRQP